MWLAADCAIIMCYMDFIAFILALCAAVCTALAVVFYCCEQGFLPSKYHFIVPRRPLFEMMIIAICVLGAIHHGSTKPMSVVTHPKPSLSQIAIPSTEPLASQSSNEYPSATPCNEAQLFVTNTDWLAFGAHEDWFYIDEGNWCFRFGSNLCERIVVHSCGTIRSIQSTWSNRISIIDRSISIAPSANWKYLPNGRQSLFRHSVSSSNTITLIWQNALLDQSGTKPISIYAELFPSGAALFRYDFSAIDGMSSLTNATLRVWRDGLLQTFPIPLNGSHVSIPGPTMQADTLENVYRRIADGDMNAYYSADISVEKGPSRIDVKGDRDSILGEYSFIAKAGETNTFPLLIGVKHIICTEAAISHIEIRDDERWTESSHPTIGNGTEHHAELQWPVLFSLEKISQDSTGEMLRLDTMPDFLNGNIVWNGAKKAKTFYSADGCQCECLDYSGSNVISHIASCSCVQCMASGWFAYEGHTERFSIDVKAKIGGDSPSPDEEDNGEDPDPEAAVAVSIEDAVIIFEDRYEDHPGFFVQRQSTQTKLTVTAYGGERGGSINLMLPNEIALCDGFGPLSTLIEPRQSVKWEAQCHGVSASANEGATFVTVKFYENETGAEISDTDRLTVIRINVSPMNEAPENTLSTRHKLGIGETILCRQSPSTPTLSWSANHGMFRNEGNMLYFDCPLEAATDPICVSSGTVKYTPGISVVKPQNVNVDDVRSVSYGSHPNEAGYLGMELDLSVSPKDVSFRNISIEEVPCDIGVHTGHFSHQCFSNVWSHTRENGAGLWHSVGFDNDFAVDLAECSTAIPRLLLPDLNGLYDYRWTSGFLSWNVPYGWAASNCAMDAEPLGRFAEDVRHEVTLSPDGTTSIMKFGNVISRMTNDMVRLNGVIQ